MWGACTRQEIQGPGTRPQFQVLPLAQDMVTPGLLREPGAASMGGCQAWVPETTGVLSMDDSAGHTAPVAFGGGQARLQAWEAQRGIGCVSRCDTVCESGAGV